MADIVCSTECASGVVLGAFPGDCDQVDFGFPKLILLAPSDYTMTTVSSDAVVPAVSDFNLSIGSDMIVINDISNGIKMPSEVVEISDADTADNLPETITSREGISGNLKRFNLALLNQIEVLNCHKRLKMWYVTNKGWCFGGLLGYTVSNYFKDIEHAGYGNRSMIPLEFKWIREAKTSGAAYDDDYLTLVNA
jgi:hypothetical protein